MSKNEMLINKELGDNNYYRYCSAVYGSFSTVQGDFRRGWFAFNHSNGNYAFLGRSMGNAVQFIRDEY